LRFTSRFSNLPLYLNKIDRHFDPNYRTFVLFIIIQENKIWRVLRTNRSPTRPDTTHPYNSGLSNS
ncbi:MAG: hypothetical protein WHV66_09325, partial [Anaerolineales bacterium]